MNEQSELPPDIRTLTAGLFDIVEESGQGHARVRVTNAALLIRRAFPTAAGVLVDTLGWYDRVGGIDVLEIHDQHGKVLWRCTCSAPHPADDTTTADEQQLRNRLLAEAENELTAALDFATPEASGWVEREINDEDERPYWIDLPTATQSTYPEWRPTTLTSAAALSAVAHGVPVAGHDLAGPAAIEHFERIWAGQEPGFDERQLRAKLKEMRELLAGLYAHRVQPRSIVGSSVKPSARREAAVAWLTREITQLENDIATRGRTNAVNNSNVRLALNTSHESVAGFPFARLPLGRTNSEHTAESTAADA